MYCGSRRTTNTCIDGSICSACSFHVSACSSNRLDYSIDELILGGAAINGRGLAGAPAGHLPGTWRWWPAGPSLASARPGPGVRARCLTLAQAGRRRLRRWEKPAVPSAEMDRSAGREEDDAVEIKLHAFFFRPRLYPAFIESQ